MKITSIEKLEDCFGGVGVYAFHFDQPWTRTAIQQVAGLGKLEYFADFPLPFFRLSVADGLQVKGVEGLPHCRIIVPHDQHVRFGQELERILAAAPKTQAE